MKTRQKSHAEAARTRIVDVHSHILPGIDDGSRNVEESINLLEQLKSQGIDTVTATPHFYPSEQDLSSFLEKRQAAYEKLKENYPSNLPDIRLGAEVLYYNGISRMKELAKLCTERTDFLLLEMPSTSWSDYMVREVTEMSRCLSMTVMLAHFERYLSSQSAQSWESLLQSGVLLQSNADFFLNFGTKRRAMRFLSDETIFLIGSDCHRIDRRFPRMGEAIAQIERKLGKPAIERLERNCDVYLKESLKV